MPGLMLKGIRKTYPDGTSVLHGIDLAIAEGCFAVLVGPSGCGKTTLLRIIAGLEPLTAGEIHLGGRCIHHLPPVDRGVAMVFQNHALYPHMTVAQNMGFALKMAGRPKAEIQARVGWAADILQISPLLDRKPRTLSGGQCQRVAIGRAIVRKPQVFLFDEPLSHLDASLRVQMRIELAKLHREIGSTMVYVTHDQVEAMTLGDRIAVLNGGRVEQFGSPQELYDAPENPFVAGFLGTPRMVVVPCQAERTLDGIHLHVGTAGTLKLVSAAADALAGARSFGIRPEQVTLAQPGEGLAARVDLVEHLGDANIAYVTLQGTPHAVAIRLAIEQGDLTVGQAVHLLPRTKGLHLFDEGGRAIRLPNRA